MATFKIQTITKQQPSTIERDGDKVFLGEAGDAFIIEKLVNVDGSDKRAIISPSVGPLQVLTPLVPVFDPACPDAKEGEVKLSNDPPAENGRFPWQFAQARGEAAVTISVACKDLPGGTSFPGGGRIFLVWEGAEVKWRLSRDALEQAPGNSTWVLIPTEVSALARPCVTRTASKRRKSTAVVCVILRSCGIFRSPCSRVRQIVSSFLQLEPLRLTQGSTLGCEVQYPGKALLPHLCVSVSLCRISAILFQRTPAQRSQADQRASVGAAF